MAIQTVQPYLPLPSVFQVTYFNSLLIDTSGEKAAFITQIPKTGTISKVGFRTATVTTAQTLKVSLQGVNTSGDPDGTILGSGNAYGTQASPASNTWYTVTLTSGLSVTKGDAVAVVVEFDTTVGNLNIAAAAKNYSTPDNQQIYSDLYTTSWAKAGNLPTVSFEYSDGSYAGGTTIPTSAFTNTTFNGGSTPDEYGVYFQVPFPCRATGAWVLVDLDADATLKLYDSDGSTVLASTALPSAQRDTTSTGVSYRLFSSSVNLSKNTWYRLTIVPDSVSNIAINRWTMPSVAAMDSLPLGQKCYETSRTDAGAWTETTTNRPLIGLLVDGFDDGVSAGGGISKARLLNTGF